jgi:5-methylcytosine-specific restriction protein A
MPMKPPTFRPPHLPSREQLRREADARRGSAAERGYGKRWSRVAAMFKAAHPLCLGCSAIGRIAATDCVDHIVPHRGDPALLWDMRDLRLDSALAKRLSGANDG